MIIDIKGTVEAIGNTQEIGDKGFKKRVLVVKLPGKFEEVIPIDFLKEGCGSLDALKVGDAVEVKAYLGGRKWQKDALSEVKYFTSVRGVEVKVICGEQTTLHLDPQADEIPF